MVSKESVESQLIKLGFNFHGWLNRAEVRELPHVLLPDEEIYECVNGYYDGGFALLIATNIRVLLIDKKPLNFLTVEDLRFDMINELDYSHRMLGAQISISAGNKNLKFRSYNQPRLRKLIGHVQHCMAEIKKRQSQHQVGQSQHLEKINQQLQTYLLAQYQSQLEFSQQLREAQARGLSMPAQPAPVKPEPELADYLYAQSLMRQHNLQPEQSGGTNQFAKEQKEAEPTSIDTKDIQATVNDRPPVQHGPAVADAQMAELYDEGRREIFGNVAVQPAPPAPAANTPAQPAPQNPPAPTIQSSSSSGHGLEINPLSIAYSKLPMALRNRKFGRPSFHAHSRAQHHINVGPQPAN